MLASNSEYREMLNSLERAVGSAESRSLPTIVADTRAIRLLIEIARKRAKINERGPVYVLDKNEVEYDDDAGTEYAEEQ